MHISKKKLVITMLLLSFSNLNATDYMDDPNTFKEEQLKKIETYKGTLDTMLQKANEYMDKIGINPPTIINQNEQNFDTSTTKEQN